LALGPTAAAKARGPPGLGSIILSRLVFRAL
jgi:hypothetical protein